MASPALTLLRGAGAPSELTLGIVRNAVAYWERAVDQAVDELLDATTSASITEARRRIEVAHDRLCAVRNRRDRLIAERNSERWLWVAGPADEVRFG